MTVDIDVVVKNFWVTSGFGLQVMRIGSLGVSCPYELQISCLT